MISQIKNATNSAVNFFLDLLFPRFCLSCGREGAYLCENCKNNLRYNEIVIVSEAKQSQLYHHPFCPVCKNKLYSCHSRPVSQYGVNSGGNPDLKCPRKCKMHIKLALAPFSYDTPLIKNLIHNFKYNFIKSLGADLADFMIESINASKLFGYSASRLDGFLIVPVPLHRRRLAWRGFNQSEILARKISEKLNIEFQSALKRIKNTKPQIEMASADERKENIKNAFTIKMPDTVKNKIIILVDDMLTTGATIEECARILRQSGAREIWALTVAK